MTLRFLTLMVAAGVLAGCGQVWNDPYPAAEQGSSILYSAFTQRAPNTWIRCSPGETGPFYARSMGASSTITSSGLSAGSRHGGGVPVLRQYDRSEPAGQGPAKVARV